MMKCRLPGYRRAFTLIELLVVIAIIGLLMALLLPAVQKIREAANNMSCENNLKQIGIACHHYANDYGGVPPWGTKTPTYWHGWMTMILPYVEQDNLVKNYHWDAHWWDSQNRPVVTRRLAIFQCPSTSEPNRDCPQMDNTRTTTYPASATDYTAMAGIAGVVVQAGLLPAELDRSGIMQMTLPRPLTHVYDGTSNTMMIVEAAGRPYLWRNRHRDFTTLYWPAMGPGMVQEGGWAYWANNIAARGHTLDGLLTPGPGAINRSNYIGVYAFHPSGANILFGDASVRMLHTDLDIYVFYALASRNGGEVNTNDGF